MKTAAAYVVFFSYLALVGCLVAAIAGFYYNKSLILALIVSTVALEIGVYLMNKRPINPA